MAKYVAPTYSEPELRGAYNQFPGMTVRIYRRTVTWTRKKEFQFKVTVNESIFNDDDSRWYWDFNLNSAAGGSLLEVAGYQWDALSGEAINIRSR